MRLTKLMTTSRKLKRNVGAHYQPAKSPSRITRWPLGSGSVIPTIPLLSPSCSSALEALNPLHPRNS